jgi:hypothetical protein
LLGRDPTYNYPKLNASEGWGEGKHGSFLVFF